MTEAHSQERFRSLQAVVDDYIEVGIKAAHGNITEAAKLLGVGRATLYRRGAPNSERARFTRTPRVRTEEKEAFKRRVLELRRIVEQASAHPVGDYELGCANGLIRALHLLEGRTGSPAYL